MAEDFDVEAMLEAPYKEKVSMGACMCFLVEFRGSEAVRIVVTSSLMKTNKTLGLSLLTSKRCTYIVHLLLCHNELNFFSL